MAVEIIPSSFECDCGQNIHFFEKTVNEMKKMSKRKRVTLSENNHYIVFYKEKAIEIICPKLDKCIINESR